jgi:hypothetical protein
MKRKLEAVIAVLLSLARPQAASAECAPIAVIGNSHVVAMGEYVERNRIDETALRFRSAERYASQKQGCTDCDPFSYNGRNIARIRQEMPSILDELEVEGIDRVIIYEGTNSLWLGEKRLKSYLTDIVKTFHSHSKAVYIAEMPLGVADANVMTGSRGVRAYNRIIREVGADGIVEAMHVPWKARSVHGYTPDTFPYLLKRFKAVAECE